MCLSGALTDLPVFFADYDRFMRPIESIKWSSQLGGTELMRIRFSKLLRVVTTVLSEKIHKPEQKMMLLFLTVRPLFAHRESL